MEVGVDVWIKDEVSDQAWLPGVIAEKVCELEMLYTY
jgi:hypothetical protein